MDESISEWIKRQMARRDWSQSDLARHMGVSPSRVSDWVNGKRQPSPASAERLADVFRTDVDIVLTLAGHRPLEDDTDDPVRTALMSKLRRVRLHVYQRDRLIGSLLDEMITADREEAAK